MSWSDPPTNAPRRRRFDLSPIQLVIVLVIVAVFAFAIAEGDIARFQLIYFAMLVPSIVLHEVSHGALALAFGDDTAKRAGRLTLNPIKHIDPIGTVLLPVILVISFGTAFGYAKPVPVDTSRMSRNQAMFTGLVGPFTNILIALGVSLAFALLGTGMGLFTFEILLALGFANVVLAAFNLIPIPPLDGSSVIERFLPSQYMAGYLKFRQYSMWILLGILLLLPGVLAGVFDPALSLWGMTLPEWLEQSLIVQGLL